MMPLIWQSMADYSLIDWESAFQFCVQNEQTVDRVPSGNPAQQSSSLAKNM